MLQHGHHIGQHLRGMKFIGQPVPDRDPGIPGKLLHNGLAETTVFDTVIHPAQYPGRIFHGLFMTDLRTRRAQIGNPCTLVPSCHFKGTSCSRGAFFKDQGYIPALQPLYLFSTLFLLLQGKAQIKQVPYLTGVEIQQFQEMPVTQVVLHVQDPFNCSKLI